MCLEDLQEEKVPRRPPAQTPEPAQLASFEMKEQWFYWEIPFPRDLGSVCVPWRASSSVNQQSAHFLKCLKQPVSVHLTSSADEDCRYLPEFLCIKPALVQNPSPGPRPTSAPSSCRRRLITRSLCAAAVEPAQPSTAEVTALEQGA
ncbi:unnamed protein product [Pleuronectes platessa]|uniref:Uncharacterized protein n=1 Tax=Pleuronectes platessa TaxID=8262 RepID=A0A9N7UPC7_PLEPL|nr:unnamed protein product [Pleuronectes platessa]